MGTKAGGIKNLTIRGDYAQPVNVNGFACKNCTDVEYAKKHIDPAHPKDGPYGIAKREDAARPVTGASATPAGRSDTPAVTFGGSLAAMDSVTASSPTQNRATQGIGIDLSV